MAGQSRISDSDAKKAWKDAQEWQEKHNFENPDSHAEIRQLVNGVVQMFVHKNDLEQAMKDAQDEARAKYRVTTDENDNRRIERW